MKDSIIHQNNLCTDWKRELQFFRDETAIMLERLDEVAKRNTGKEIAIQVSHFENKFRIMKQHFDELKHDVGQLQKSLAGSAMAKPAYISVKMVETDGKLEDLMDFTSKDFYDTKKEYYRFLSATF